jgi:beta-phosphoglucomutase-like phosphatase (HAD superfamily)
VVIEDSTNGIAAANAAGIFCIGFKSPHSKNQDYTKASKTITDFSEIRYHQLQLLKHL